MNALGIHLLADLKKCSPEKLGDPEFVKKSIMRAATISNATILGEFLHDFDPGGPGGITGVIPIAESHLSIHTWPEHGYAMVDVCTCGNHMNPDAAVNYLVDVFECKEPSIIEVKRGILDPSGEKNIPHKPDCP